jgi:uncharacterized membrane protein YdjX (TVP38/TMEM64 family)
MNQSFKKLLYAGIFITINIFVWYYFDIGSILTLETLKQHRIWLQEMTEKHYLFTVMSYILIYTLDAALFLPATAILIMIGGFLFGVFPATCYAVIGATTGATIAFLLTRYFLGSIMQARYGHRLTTFNKLIEQNYVRYLLFVRLIPVFPFFLTNILAGLTLIPIKVFIVTTALGIIPNVIIYASIGRHLLTLNSITDIFTVKFTLAILALCCLSLLPLIIKTDKQGPT